MLEQMILQAHLKLKMLKTDHFPFEDWHLPIFLLPGGRKSQTINQLYIDKKTRSNEINGSKKKNEV